MGHTIARCSLPRAAAAPMLAGMGGQWERLAVAACIVLSALFAVINAVGPIFWPAEPSVTTAVYEWDRPPAGSACDAADHLGGC